MYGIGSLHSAGVGGSGWLCSAVVGGSVNCIL